MNKEEKKKLILDFINGPLREYLEEKISFGKFKEKINEVCGTDFSYSDLYPSYLFNASLSYEEEIKSLQESINSLSDLHTKYKHFPKDCVVFNESRMMCEFCTTKWYNCAKCDALYDEQECTCKGK